MSLRRYPTPWYRFDAPAGEYSTLYASVDRIATFAEVYRGRGSRIEHDEADRYLVRLSPTRPLTLIDLREHDILVALNLDERISVGDDYVACQAWALAFYRSLPEVMGICYRSRLAGVLATNVVLFTDRAAALVDIVAEGRLRDLESTVLAAAERFGLTVLFRFD